MAKEMTEEDWNNAENRCIGLILSGDAVDELDSRGNRISDDTFLILLNAHHEAVRFHFTRAQSQSRQWQVVLDTREGMARRTRRVNKGAIYIWRGARWLCFGCSTAKKIYLGTYRACGQVFRWAMQ